MNTISLQQELEPYLTEDSKKLINKVYNSTVAMIKPNEYRLCHYCGIVIETSRFDTIPNEAYEMFAGYINKAVEHGLFKYGVSVLPPTRNLRREFSTIHEWVFTIFPLSDIKLGEMNNELKEIGLPELAFNEGDSPKIRFELTKESKDKLIEIRKKYLSSTLKTDLKWDI